MTRCPYSSCKSSNIKYRYYSSSSWTSTWRCDMCEDEIYSGNNYYHCRSCCDRGGSSHEPEVTRCSGMYCTYCVNKKNDEWQQEKRELQQKAAKAEAALQDEQDRLKEIADKKKHIAQATLVKSNNFINKCDDKVSKIQAIDNDSKIEEQNIPSKEDLDSMESECTQYIQQINANVAAVQEATNSTIEEITGMKTIADEKQMQEAIEKIEQCQEVITQHKKKIRENITKTNEQEIEVVEKEKIVNEQIIKAKRDQNNLYSVDAELDDLRSELQGLSGEEINSNPDAVKKMNGTYDKLLKLMQEKHASNKQRVDELKDTKKRITKIRAKLMSAKSHNKYLLECLDAEYDQLNKAAQNVMIKFEKRAVYFLTFDCNLKDEDMQKFEDYGIHDDMDGIMELTDAELADIGIEKKGVRNRILRNINKLKEENK